MVVETRLQGRMVGKLLHLLQPALHLLQTPACRKHPTGRSLPEMPRVEVCLLLHPPLPPISHRSPASPCLMKDHVLTFLCLQAPARDLIGPRTSAPGPSGPHQLLVEAPCPLLSAAALVPTALLALLTAELRVSPPWSHRPARCRSRRNRCGQTTSKSGSSRATSTWTDDEISTTATTFNAFYEIHWNWTLASNA